MKKIIALALILGLLCGCTEVTKTMQNMGIPTEDIPFNITDHFGDLSHVEMSTLEWGAGGALGGYAFAKLSKGDAKTHVLAGAAIGALAGNWYAQRQLARSEELKKIEDNLDAQIQYAQKANEDAETYIKELRAEIKNTQAKIKEAQHKKEKNLIKQSQLEEEQESLNQVIRTAQENEIIMEAQVKEIRAYRAKQANASAEYQSQMDKEIEQLELKLETAKEITRELASLKY